MADNDKPTSELPQEQSRIVIKPNGEVVIENLSMSLLELAQLLDPDSEVACRLPDADEEDAQDDDGDA